MIKLRLSEIAEAVGGKLVLCEGAEDRVVTSLSIDTRALNEGDLFCALIGERFDAHDFIESLPDTVSGVITQVEKNVPFAQIVVEDTTAALGRLGAYCRERANPRFCVGITGSVGKTTTKEMITDILSKGMQVHSTVGNFNNAIGLPLTLLGLEEEDEALVCEMGMSGFGEISYLTSLACPNIALITNIGMSHIEMLGSREGIRDAKLEIIEGMKEGDTLILNGDEPLLCDARVREKTAHLNVIYVGFDRENDIYPTDIYRGRNYLSFDIVSPMGEERVTIPAIGDHFVRNALFACAVAQVVGVGSEEIQRGFSSYEPQGLRQKIYERRGITVIADCYNAGPESMTAALKVLQSQSGRKIAVLGDMMELGSMSTMAHQQLGREVVECEIDVLYTYGEHSKKTAEEALSCGFSGEKILSFADREALAKELSATLRPGDHVLFKASRKMALEQVIELSDLGE
ncbi:MAG: UDP-N-acetylmuramoyl-tripeptide--D-alanyl-D-alanine ligase [Clostridia bacterium]|nr:UDP-N-acetylmuramoyl-tripeptide--D-alanyl-D-alanine ligase [Clostridia bacterium]